MTNRKKIILLICLILFILLIYEIIHTLALFQTDTSGKVGFTEAKWNVEVNGKKVTQKEKVSFTIEDLDTESSTHVKSGNLAPGLSTSFDIKIDPKDTQVAIRYDITVDKKNIEKTNLSVTGITETNGRTLVETSKGVFTGVMPLEYIQSGSLDELRVTLKWNDTDSYENLTNNTTGENESNMEENSEENNTIDSENNSTADSSTNDENNNTVNIIRDEEIAGSYDAKVSLPVSIIISQYQGEEIKAYN